MNNLANTPTPLSPEEAYLASKLLGKSLFSAIQLTKEIDRMKELQQHEANDVLKIPLPVQKMSEEKSAGVLSSFAKSLMGVGEITAENLARRAGMGIRRSVVPATAGAGGVAVATKKKDEKDKDKDKKEKKANDLEGQPPGIIGRALRFNRNPIRTLVGGEAGFSEARREYYDMEKRQIQKALQEAQQEYLATLQRIKQGEETPRVDAFCNGIATELLIPELAKTSATAEDVEIGDGSIKRLIKKTLGIAAKPVQPAIDLGATGLLGTAGGTGYLAYVLKKKMREKDQDSYLQSALPTRVELEPYNI